ncbi:hypothetical protein Y695_02020 [Hydrogenophaga sp. T4]|nr:hypothetical protein Y695_02020 [Hydrogenophaga sp. T4]
MSVCNRASGKARGSHANNSSAVQPMTRSKVSGTKEGVMGLPVSIDLVGREALVHGRAERVVGIVAQHLHRYRQHDVEQIALLVACIEKRFDG